MPDSTLISPRHRRRRRGGQVSGYSGVAPVAAAAFPTGLLPIKVEIAPGADQTKPPQAWDWRDITSFVRGNDGSNKISIMYNKRDEYTTAQPSTCRLMFDNTDGRFSARNPSGAYYPNLRRGTPIRVRVNYSNTTAIRFLGFLDELPPRWDTSGNDRYVPVTASGIFRRLGQGSAIRSALFRTLQRATYLPGSYVTGYWPGEDGSGATTVASAITGHTAGIKTGTVTFAGDSSPKGSKPIATVANGATLTFTVPDYTAPSTGVWNVHFLCKFPAAFTTQAVVLEVQTTGAPNKWQLTIDPSSSPDKIKVRAYDHTGPELLADAGANFLIGTAAVEPYDAYLWGQLLVYQSGSLANWNGTFRTDAGETQIAANGVTGTVGKVLSVKVAADANLDGFSFGHLLVTSSDAYPNDAGIGVSIVSVNANATTGFAGENSTNRFDRLCDEDGIAANHIYSLLGSLTSMGTQPTDSLLNLLREIETAEVGDLIESIDGPELIKYLEHGNRYNQTAALTLDVASGQVAPPFEPTDDDQLLRNDVTASQPSGTSVRYLDAASILRDGVYDETAQVNLYYARSNDDFESDLGQWAAWRVNRSLVDDLRYPQVGLNLARDPSLIPAWLSCRPGSRISVTNPPAGLPPDTIDLQIEGWTEILSQYTWDVELFCSSAQPWNVYVVQTGGTNLSRLDGSSTLTTAVTAGDTSLSITTASGPVWTTQAGDVPFDIAVGGERMTVTAVTGSSSPQTFTVTRSVNGVSKGQAAGTAVTLWRPGKIAL